MLAKGTLSALTISRELSIGRTKVYRILDKLSDKALVYQKLGELGLKFGATSQEELKNLVANKEHEVRRLQEALPKVLDILSTLVERDSSSSVRYYSGQRGLTTGDG